MRAGCPRDGSISPIGSECGSISMDLADRVRMPRYFDRFGRCGRDAGAISPIGSECRGISIGRLSTIAADSNAMAI
jgi:hypothetical protein